MLANLKLDCLNSRIFCERERRTIFERKAWASEKNGEGEWWETLKSKSFLASHARGRVRLARFTLEDHAYDASRLPKTTVLQSNLKQTLKESHFCFSYKWNASMTRQHPHEWKKHKKENNLNSLSVVIISWILLVPQKWVITHKLTN